MSVGPKIFISVYMRKLRGRCARINEPNVLHRFVRVMLNLKRFVINFKGFVIDLKRLMNDPKGFVIDLKGVMNDQKRFMIDIKGFMIDLKRLMINTETFVRSIETFMQTFFLCLSCPVWLKLAVQACKNANLGEFLPFGTSFLKIGLF